MSVLPCAENDPTASYNLIADLLTNNNLRKNLMVLFLLNVGQLGIEFKNLKRLNREDFALFSLAPQLHCLF